MHEAKPGPGSGCSACHVCYATHSLQLLDGTIIAGSRAQKSSLQALLVLQGKIRTGNQCAKPSLLLHPWSVRKTSAKERCAFLMPKSCNLLPACFTARHVPFPLHLHHVRTMAAVNDDHSSGSLQADAGRRGA